MTHLFSKHWKIVMLVLLPLLVSLACSVLQGGPGADNSTPKDVIVEMDVVYGPGNLILPDTTVGLANLTSYKATLVLSFDGTLDDKTAKWSQTYVMLTTKEPAARQLTLEKTGDLPDLNAVFMAEINGAAYERLGENACAANVIEEGNSLSDQLEPAGFLTGVHGAEEAGKETANDTASNHYTFDERAFGQLNIAQSTGEMWVASEGGYVVKYLLTTKGDANYFGEGMEGTISFDYELTDVNKPVEFAPLPADCPAGMVNAPLLPDASNVIKMPSVLLFETASSPADVAAFYQEQIPTLGWKPSGQPAFDDTTALLIFTQVKQTLTVVVNVIGTRTKVQLVLENTPK